MDPVGKILDKERCIGCGDKIKDNKSIQMLQGLLCISCAEENEDRGVESFLLRRQ